MKITSIHNDNVKYWVSLKNKKIRDKERKFIVEGDHLIEEARKNNLIEYIISCVDENADFYVTKEIMEKISDQKSISYNAAVVKFIPEDSVNGNVIILDNLQDPGNLGTIIRSSVAFNIDTIIISDTSVDLYNPKVVRSTEGMIFNLNIIRRNLEGIIPVLKNLGYKIVGTDVNEGIDVRNISKENVAIIIGNEGNGMSENVKEMCDEFINIKINKSCESLNAGVAASIIMYEVSHE
ncbi:RNA methyltransferase [bacterium]|nr:RNA methyltransferase [bacterium]